MNPDNVLLQYIHERSHEESTLGSPTNPNEPMVQYFYELSWTQPIVPPQWMI
jgi:hypothetical protein